MTASGLPGERRGVEDHHVAGVAGGVVDHGQHPALVVGPPVGVAHEDRLAGREPGPGSQWRRLVAGQVVADQAVEVVLALVAGRTSVQ